MSNFVLMRIAFCRGVGAVLRTLRARELRYNILKSQD